MTQKTSETLKALFAKAGLVSGDTIAGAVTGDLLKLAGIVHTVDGDIWDPIKHPRNANGHFIKKGAGVFLLGQNKKGTFNSPGAKKPIDYDMEPGDIAYSSPLGNVVLKHADGSWTQMTTTGQKKKFPSTDPIAIVLNKKIEKGSYKKFDEAPATEVHADSIEEAESAKTTQVKVGDTLTKAQIDLLPEGSKVEGNKLVSIGSKAAGSPEKPAEAIESDNPKPSTPEPGKEALKAADAALDKAEGKPKTAAELLADLKAKGLATSGGGKSTPVEGADPELVKKFPVGKEVEVNWNDSMTPAKVLSVTKDGKVAVLVKGTKTPKGFAPEDVKDPGSGAVGLKDLFEPGTVDVKGGKVVPKKTTAKKAAAPAPEAKKNADLEGKPVKSVVELEKAPEGSEVVVTPTKGDPETYVKEGDEWFFLDPQNGNQKNIYGNPTKDFEYLLDANSGHTVAFGKVAEPPAQDAKTGLKDGDEVPESKALDALPVGASITVKDTYNEYEEIYKKTEFGWSPLAGVSNPKLNSFPSNDFDDDFANADTKVFVKSLGEPDTSDGPLLEFDEVETEEVSVQKAPNADLATDLGKTLTTKKAPVKKAAAKKSQSDAAYMKKKSVESDDYMGSTGGTSSFGVSEADLVKEQGEALGKTSGDPKTKADFDALPEGTTIKSTLENLPDDQQVHLKKTADGWKYASGPNAGKSFSGGAFGPEMTANSLNYKVENKPAEKPAEKPKAVPVPVEGKKNKLTAASELDAAEEGAAFQEVGGKNPGDLINSEKGFLHPVSGEWFPLEQGDKLLQHKLTPASFAVMDAEGNKKFQINKNGKKYKWSPHIPKSNFGVVFTADKGYGTVEDDSLPDINDFLKGNTFTHPSSGQSFDIGPDEVLMQHNFTPHSYLVMDKSQTTMLYKIDVKGKKQKAGTNLKVGSPGTELEFAL